MLDRTSDKIADTLEADVVIIGSGIAGIAIARRLAARNIRSIVVESGAEPFDRRWRLLPARPEAPHDRVRQDYIDLHVQRSFGGASNVWGGWCTSMRAVNFARRDLPDYPGWPISRDDLIPYYRAAGAVLALDDPDSVVAAHADLDGIDGIVVKPFSLSPPIRVPESWGEELKASPHIHVILGLTAETFGADKGRVTHLTARRDSGQPVRLAARQFVVAGGACNNAMLLSRNAQALGMPAESRRHIGANFFEHPQIYDFATAFLRPEVEDAFLNYQPWTNGSLAVTPPESHLASRGLLDFFIGAAIAEETRWTDAHRAIAANCRAIHGRRPRLFSLMVGMELAPDRSNRLTAESGGLSYEGAGTLALDFGAGTADLAQAARSWFEGVAVESWFDNPEPAQAVAVGHLMGMTPMAATPADGVVDSDCRVFGADNLYVAGSSVFPTTGAASPTLTLTALSLRIADRLSERLA